jgi:hypothetical protein
LADGDRINPALKRWAIFKPEAPAQPRNGILSGYSFS